MLDERRREFRAGLGQAYDLDFTPLTDMRATAEYRRLAAKNLLRRFFAETSGTKAPVTVTRQEAA